jgi:hypothetical protein
MRQALEDSDSSPDIDQEASIILKGPLSQVYSDALQKAYSNDRPEENATSTESQQIDATIMSKLADMLAPQQAQATDGYQTVYGVSKDQVDDEVVVDVTKELTQAPQSSDGRGFVLVIDGTQPGANGQYEGDDQVRVVSALESLVVSMGGKVFHSLKDYGQSLK